MAEYRPPLRDIRFIMENVVDLPALTKLPAYGHVDAESAFEAISEAGRLFADVIAPLNRVGDQQGSRLQPDGSVVTPDGFKEAYHRYVKSGWGAVAFDSAFGGGGFPWLVGIAIQDLLTSSNMAFSLCPMLTQSGIEMLSRYGSEEQKATYLAKMITGEWPGTMNLTEPDAGSDVGALRARAEPAGDGTWRITGQKIFITYGEHDLAEQIVHMVLARTPGAPPGTKGVSFFIVPKYLVNPDGSLGPRNDVRCVSIEHKLGIHASPTCVLSYGDRGGAVGYMVGEENEGMRYMFTMMNAARLSIGLQGLAVAERSYQQALEYAQQRRQGRTVGEAATVSSPIIEHPDVRRMLLTMRSQIEAMRCLVYLNAESMDLARAHPDAAVREARRELTDLLIPISKAWCTDLGVEIASLGIQIYGGMGYVEESGEPQYFRDARIAPIYEGTNGIQAIDLATRKLSMRGGGVMRDLIASIRSTDADLAEAGEELSGVRTCLSDGADALAEATDWLVGRNRTAPNDVLAGATPYLRMAGTVVGGWLLARSAIAACRLSGSDGADGFLRAKIATADFYARRLLPQARGLLPMVTAGAAPLYSVSPEDLA